MKSSANVDHAYKPKHFYHIYNYTANGELMFRDRNNYRFFMNRWNKYLSPFTEVYAYCLMPDHFHFLIRIKATVSGNIHQQITQAFRKFLASYTLSFNRYWNRSGSLFKESYRHIHIGNFGKLPDYITYIHEKPVEHKFVTDCRLWKYSSFRAILSNKRTKVKRREVLQLYGGKKAYLHLHQQCSNSFTQRKVAAG